MSDIKWTHVDCRTTTEQRDPWEPCSQGHVLPGPSLPPFLLQPLDQGSHDSFKLKLPTRDTGKIFPTEYDWNWYRHSFIECSKNKNEALGQAEKWCSQNPQDTNHVNATSNPKAYLPKLLQKPMLIYSVLSLPNPRINSVLCALLFIQQVLLNTCSLSSTGTNTGVS